MKNFILFFSFLLLSFLAVAESAKPTFDVKIERNVDIAIIEGQTYNNVTVELDAADALDIFTTGVKITVRDSDNPKKKIYKKRFSKSYLYGFTDGAIQVGKGNILIQLVLYKSDDGNWLMEIKEKGLY